MKLSFRVSSQFFASETEDTVSEEGYQFVRHIWNTFQIQSVRELMEFYVSMDTLSLVDVMEPF